jgi:antitoxin VapB
MKETIIEDAVRMGLSIKNAEVERLLRELADRRGVGMTEALRQVLAEELERQRSVREAAREAKLAALMEISRRGAALPRLTGLSDEEIIGYDENGLPR